MTQIQRAPISAEAYNRLVLSHGGKPIPDERYNTAVANSIASFHAVQDGCIVGFARLIGDRASYVYLQDLVVDSAMQGRGIGSRLVEEAERFMVEQQVGRGRLLLIAAEEVCDFYERLGYAESQPASRFMTKAV